MTQDFLDYLISEGYITKEELDEALLMYESWTVLQDYKTDLPDKRSVDVFINEYIDILQEGFDRLYKIKITHSEPEKVTSLEDEVIIYQLATPEKGSSFLAGFAGSETVLRRAAESLYKRLIKGLNLPEPAMSKEDAIDLFGELLNNVNGFCTFKFDAGIDLVLPEHKEQMVLKAPRIYVVTIKFKSHEIKMFLVYGASYSFGKAV